MPSIYFKLVNLWQTQKERREKYNLALSCGVNYHWARAMRDWRVSKIERLFNLVPHPDSTPTSLKYQPYLFILSSITHGQELIRPPWLRQLNSL